MTQVGLATGLAVGAGVLVLYTLLRRAAGGSSKRGRGGEASGDSSGDSGSSWLGMPIARPRMVVAPATAGEVATAAVTRLSLLRLI